MRITRAHIFGFGKWVDQTFTFNDASFICFYGKNEAGKSTLQQFFLYMLFGLPPRKLNRYKPKFSSQIGGTLTVEFTELGEVTIERVEQQFRLLLPNGEIEEDEKVLHEQLNQLHEETYRAIYGFSSLDLMQLHQMKQTELSDLLFSVSLTGSTAVYELERQLARKLDELFKPTGRRPLINEQITKVNQLEKEMLRTKGEALSYKQKIRERIEIETALEELNEDIKQLEASFIIKEKTLQFLPQIRNYTQIEEKRSLYREKQLTFPEQGIERYELLKQQLIPIKAASKSIEQTIEQYKEALIQKRNELLLPERYQQIKGLLEQGPELEHNKQKRADLAKKIEQVSLEINAALKRLHIREEDVLSFQPPFHAEATWKQLMNESSKLQHESEGIEEEAQLIEQKRQRIQKEEEKVSRQFIGYEQLQLMQAEALNRGEDAQEYTSVKTLYDWEVKRKHQSQKLLYVTSFMMLLFFSLYFIQEDSFYLAFGTASLIIGLIQLYMIRKMQAQEKMLTHKLQEIAPRSQNSELSQRKMKEQERLAHELTSLKHALKDLHIEQLQWEEKNNHFALREHKWVSAVELEREKLPLLGKVELEFWPELLQHTEKINADRALREELMSELYTIEADIAQFQSELEEVGIHVLPDEADFTIRHLQKAVKEHESLAEQISQYEQLLKEEENRLALLIEEKKVIKSQIDDLFKVTKVREEEQFYQVARQVEEKKELETKAAELRSQLEAIFSTSTLASLTETAIDEFSLQKEVKHLGARIDEFEAKAESLRKQLATLQVEIAQLESSDDYSLATHRYEFERDKLNELAEEWSVIKLAEAALQKAKVAYQQKYITDVIAYTSTFFNFLTSNRYVTVYLPTEKSTFQVEANNKMRYTVEELSKGTIDQLYVALRFAISKVMSEKFVVPFMIDDAFVHFDEERASLAIQLLEQIASEQQVILYTCRKHVADAVNETKSLRINL